MNQDAALRETLHRLIDQLTDDEAEELLDYLNLQADPDTLDAEEAASVRAAREEIARGEFVSFEDVKRRLARE